MSDQEPLSPRHKELLDQAHRSQTAPQKSASASSAQSLAPGVIPILYHNTRQNRMIIGIFLALGVGMLIWGVISHITVLIAMGGFFLVFVWLFKKSSGVSEALSGDGAPALFLQDDMISGYLEHPVPIHEACFDIYNASERGLHLRFESPNHRPQTLGLGQFLMADGSSPDRESLERVLLDLGMQKAPELSLREELGKVFNRQESN